MKKINTNFKKGFTIIEVVLVLAIAGLIFMMVFTALPALQRSQRDTQRNNDIARLQSAITQYQANNRNKVPTGIGVTGAEEEADLKDEIGNACTGDHSSWCYFYAKYLLVGSAGSVDVFADPNGEPYSIAVYDCDPAAGDTYCNANVQRADITFDEQSEGSAITSSNSDLPYSIAIVTNATCEGDQAKYSKGSRRLAYLYKREGGGSICLNN